MPDRRHGRHGRPPWWPEGEQWPPAGPPWRHAPGRFRRRFLVFAAVAFVLLAGLGIAAGSIFGHWEGRPGPPGPGGGNREDRGPFPGVAIVIGLAALGGTALAYRRVAGPVGDLLEAADRVGAGEYEGRVQPRGPREVQSLMRTFNDMSGRLEAADAARRQFLADVTHELRTPLAVLQSGIEAQLDGIHPRDDTHLASLLDETHVLTRVVEDLHTLALAGAGRLTLHREPIDATDAVTEALAAHAATAASRGVTLSAAPPGSTASRAAATHPSAPATDPPAANDSSAATDAPAATAAAGGGAALSPDPMVEADPVRLQQVLGNLLGNAIRHTPAGGRVTVTAERSGTGRILFTVADTGPGFPAEQLHSLFDRYTKSEASGGSGLGLAIARDLVLAHGGTIEATNPAGGGAAVSFCLPEA